MMKTNQNNHIMNMNKGMKQKLSMLLIACLLFTGYRGLTIPGRAEQGNTEQNNEISVSGTQVKVQLLGEDLRRAAKETIEKGERVDDSVLKGYSKDEELQKSYAGIFSLDKEVYEIPLDSISEGLSESLAEEEAGLQVFVERDAQDLDNLVRKESKESLLLYDGKSQLEQLFPKGEETESVKKEEEENLASDSNLVRNTELTGSELITFLYKNKADHRITFQLSVDGNKYPKVTVSPKTQLFKELVDKLKKEEKKVPVETTKAPESKIEESTEAKNTASEAQLAESTTSSEEVKETAKQAASKEETTEASVTEASAEGSASKVSIVSEEKKEEASKQETSEAAVKAEEKNEESAEAETATEAPVKKESTKEVEVKFSGFLQDVISHYEEFLGELVSARFTQYSLNELGRKSQNAEIENFATVEVFYDKDAFDEDVVLEAKRLVKPEEEGQKEGEKLTEEQVKAMKDQAIYDDSDALDIRFVSKDDRTKEVEPKVPVSVRLTFDKEAVPEEANADTIAIHHIVEDKDSGKVKMVETVVRAELEKKAEELAAVAEPEDDEKSLEGNLQKKQTVYSEALKKLEREVNLSEKKEIVTKEFVVSAFSPYIVTWQCNPSVFYGIRFHYVDKNFKEIGPTVYEKITKWQDQIGNNSSNNPIYYKKDDLANSIAYKTFENFELKGVGGQKRDNAGDPYVAMPELVEGYVFKDNKWIYYKGTEIISIDKSEFRWNTLNPKMELFTEFTWGCAYTDFYFIYELKTKDNKPKEKNISPILSNEKFITDNLDGTYDLTLTGQVKQDINNKQKLDVVFVYDNTAVMATGFDFNEKLKKLSEEDYANEDSAKSTKVKNEIKKFIERLSQSDSDVRYALVTMDGDKGFKNIVEEVKAKYDSFDSIHYKNTNAILGGKEKDEQGNKDINIVGEYKGDKGANKVWLDEATDYDGMSSGFNVDDEAYNDTKHVMGFTQNPRDILDKLDALDEKKSTFKNEDKRTISGENYASAMKNVKALMGQGDYEGPSSGRINSDSKVRSDAEKIVIFIAGGNPKFATIQETGVYDDTHRFNDSDYYIIRRKYNRGWSYGNGYSINFSALNQARGELSTLTNIDAFYSIGVGAKTNWKYLNDFAMGQYHDTDGNRERITENGKTDFFDVLHPDRRERALANNVRYKCFDASSESGLSSALQQIYERVARNHVNNIVIRDVLTKNVQPIMKDGKPDVVGQLVKMKPNGNKQAVEVEKVLESTDMQKLGLNGFTIEAKKVSAGDTGIDGLSYDGERWLLTLKTDPEDFALPAGYDIRMVARIEATADGKKNGTFANLGEARTDLNAIYKEYLGREYHDKTGQPDNMFNSSTGKFGLFTNEVADISYKTRKPDGSQETPPPKKYNKPIIRMGNLVFEKTFVGIEDKDFFKPSTGEFTELGKKVLKQINFNVFEEKKGKEELLLTINLGDEEIIKNLGKDPFEYKGYILQFTRGTGTQVSITMKGMPLDRFYRVQEELLAPEKELRESETATSGYKFDKKLHNPGKTEAQHLIVNSTTYSFKNNYVPVQTPKKTITIKKIVEEFGGTAYSPEATNKSFDFYIGLYRYNGAEYVPLSMNETEKIVNDWTTEHPGDSRIGKYKDKIPVPVGNNKTVMQYLPKVSLKHGESISLNLDTDLYYRILESKDKGYDAAKAEKKTPPTKVTIKEVHINDCDYSITEIFDQGDEFTFRNPRQTLVPTGLRGDITPYLFSIFGFTMMAGMYLTIRKRKKVEI